MEMNYITSGNTVIFAPSFNDELDCGLLKDYHQIIFSDYVLDNSLFERYVNYNFLGLKYIGSKFNRPVDNLPSIVTHLDFGWHFNQSIDNLPSSITHLTFGPDFNRPVDNLPSSITHLTFCSNFNCPVDNLPSSITHLTFGLPIKLTQVNFLEPHKIFYKILLEVLISIKQ